MTWQPIETAPRDGTVIDLWMVDQDGKGWREADAYYVKNGSGRRTVWDDSGSYQQESFIRDGWFAPNHDYDGAAGWADEPKHFNNHPRQKKWLWTLPTHWMLAPSPPVDNPPEP